MKRLPKLINKEYFLRINYANVRFMKSKKAFKTNYNPTNVIFTIKQVKSENPNDDLIQIHLRSNVDDKWFGISEDVDIDIYIYESQWNTMFTNEHTNSYQDQINLNGKKAIV